MGAQIYWVARERKGRSVICKTLLAGLLFVPRALVYLWPLLMRSLLVFLLLFVTALHAFAQTPGTDQILLMNGQVLKGRLLGQSTLEIRYLDTDRKGRTRERAEPTEGVFSVTDSLGRERIWYFHDTVFGNDLTIDQMRRFILGEQDARAGYKPLGPVLAGFLIGAGTTMALDLEMNAFFLPPLVGMSMILPRVHVTKGSISDVTMEGDEYYAYGYARVGRSKRVVRTLMSTFAGVAVGLALRQFVIDPALAD